MARGGLRVAKSPVSSSFMVTTSISGLSGAREDEEGDSAAGMVDSSSLADSILCLARASGTSTGILLGGVGDGGESGIEPRGGAARRLIVTLLEGGSEGIMPGIVRGGVWGVAEASSEGGDSSTEAMESGVVSMAPAVSTDRLREPPREVL